MGKSVRPNPYKRDIIVDPMGQWNHPGKNTRIPSSNITMKGVNYPVLGVSNTGQKQMMQPGKEYNFPGADYVDEYPQMKKGGSNCPKGRQIYPEFKSYQCITEQEYEILKNSKSKYLEERDNRSKKILELKNAQKWNDYKIEIGKFKNDYPNTSYVCPGPNCPDDIFESDLSDAGYDTIYYPGSYPDTEEEVKIEPIELGRFPVRVDNGPLPPLQMHDYTLPDSIEAPQYKLDPYTADRLSLDVKLPQNKIAALFDRGVIDSKGHIELGKRNKTRLIPRMVQKATGYDPAYFEGYEDEEGNFVPGELDYGNTTGSEMEFRGAASLRDFINQQKYKKEYADYDKKLDTWLEQYEQSKKKQAEGQAFKKGGAKKKYTSDIINSTNYLFAEHPLFKKKKQSKKRIYSPKASYYQDGGELPEAKYGHSIGNLIRKQDGGQTDYNIGDEVDESTMQYLKKLGFTFEKI